MSKISDNLYLFTITESEGVSEELKSAYIYYFRKHEYYLLVEEGGDGHKEHYHLHGILKSSHKRTDNVRRTLKSMYTKLNKKLTAWGTKVESVKELEGALSYVYKDKRVLCSSGIMLDNIREWVSKPKASELKGFTQVGKHNYVKIVTGYCDAKGIRPQTWQDLRHVMDDMIVEKYMFGQGNWCKEVVGKVLQYYGERRYVLSCWDQMCDISM